MATTSVRALVGAIFTAEPMVAFACSSDAYTVCMKLLMVAEGEAHLYPRFAPTMEWDTAAAQIIVEEAGGKVLIQNSQIPVNYNKENLLNPYFLVQGKEKNFS